MLNKSNPAMSCIVTIRCLLLMVLLVCPATSWAHDSEEMESSQHSVHDVNIAEVRVDGYALFRVRGFTGYPAARRSKEIAQRIIDVANKEDVPAEDVQVQDIADGRKNVLAGDKRLLTLYPEDAALEEISLDVLSEAVITRIQQSIVDYRRDRSPDVVLRNIIYALVLTLVQVVVIFGLVKLFRLFDRLVEKGLKKQIATLEKKSLNLVRARQIWGVVRSALALLRWVLIIFAFYAYLNTILALLPATREFGNQLFTMVYQPLSGMGRSIVDFIPSLIFLILLYIVTRYLLRTIRMFFNAVDQGGVQFKSFEAEWAWPTYRVIRIVVIIFAIVIAYPHIPGSDSGAFKGISLFLGVLLSLGSTSFIANLLAGYTMMYRRAFRVGDVVQIGDTRGKVMETRLLVTHLRTPKNEEIVVPNSLILNSSVTNYSSFSSSQGLVLHTVVGIGYETPWRQVEAMLSMAADRTPGVLKEPAPFVLQKSLGDFAVNYELNVHCGDPGNAPRIYSQLHQNIQDVFNEYGVQIMTPNYRSDPPEPKLVPMDQWFTSPAKPPPDGER